MRTYNTIGQDKLQIVEVPAPMLFIDWVGDRLCAATGHRWCNKYAKIANWVWDNEKVLLILPLTKEQFSVLVDYGPEDEDDDDD